MRKAIIAAIVATALFAVGAFAANFTLSAEDIASGTDSVTACASHVDIDFNEPTTAPAGSGDYVVNGATLSFYDSSGANPLVAADCEGFTAEVAIGVGGSASTLTFTEYEANAAISEGGVTTVTFNPAISVASIRAASALIDGKTLTADLAS